MKNLNLLCPENGSLREGLKSIIANITNERSLIIIDSLNGLFNVFEGQNDTGRLVNSFLMLLVSAANHTKSTIIVGVLSAIVGGLFLKNNYNKNDKTNKNFCSKCGNKIENSDNYCSDCGSKV